MNKAQLFAIFIVVVMVASTIGFSIVASINRNQGRSTTTTTLPPSLLHFKALDVEVSVEQILPAIKILGSTEQTNIFEIDSAIYEIEGISKVNSYFKTNEPGLGNKLFYVADISFSKDYSPKEIFNKIVEKAPLQETEAYAVALIRLPKTVELTSLANEELKQSHTFSDTRAQAFVNLDTIEGDNIKIELYVSLLGNKVSKIDAFESFNPATQPVGGSLKKTLPVDELLPKLVFDGRFPYVKLNSEELQQEILLLENVENAKVELQEFKPLRFSIFAENALEKKNDVNASLTLVPEITSIEFSEEETVLVFSIEFDANADYDLLKKTVESKLLELGFSKDELKVEDSELSIFGEVNLSSTDALKTANALETLLEEKKISADLHQNAKLFIETLTDDKTGNTFDVDLEYVRALVKAGHSEEDKVLFEINFLKKRNTIVFAQAIEVIEEEQT